MRFDGVVWHFNEFFEVLLIYCGFRGKFGHFMGFVVVILAIQWVLRGRFGHFNEIEMVLFCNLAI